MTEDWVVHENPAWREKADFIIGVELDADDAASPQRREQLWSTRMGDDRFQVCCIPFFAYNINLGDEVETWTQGERRYEVRRVVKDSGRYTFRVWFGDSHDRTIRDEITREAKHSGWLLEWYSEKILAISAEPALAQQTADYLLRQEQLGRLVYETGRTE